MIHRSRTVRRAVMAVSALAVISLLSVGAARDAVADAKKGRMTFSMLCQTCHGPKGEGMRTVNSPALTALNDWYIIAQLEKFKGGQRGFKAEDVSGSQMAAIAITLANEAAMQDVADYIKTLGHVPQAAPEVVGDVTKGKAIYVKVCKECHGEGAEGIEAKHSSTLVGQNDWYLLAQIDKFRTGLRGSAEGDSVGAGMAKIAKELADEAAIKDVIAYIGSLEPK